MTFAGWTPENTHHLITRWNEGVSLGRIAKELGHSRNALASKVKRLGLKPSELLRERVAAAGREGQAQFRKDVIGAYAGRCCVTDCVQQEILQAAHIVPYAMTRDHSVRNGICVRIDIHSLFDCGLIAISTDYHVRISARMTDPTYTALDDRQIRLPENPNHHPDAKWVQWHLSMVFQG